MSKLSETSVKALHWKGKDQRISDGQGLYMNLRKNSKTWIVRKSHSGKTHIITLGKWPALSCKQARLDARRYADESDISNVTVNKLIGEYKKDVVFPDSKVPKQVEGYLNHIDNVFGTFKVIAIKRAQLVYFIKQYGDERGARSADRIRSYLKQLFAYGVELGYITGASPMDGVTKRVTGYKPVERSRVLSADEIRMVWSWKNPERGWQNTEENLKVIKFLLLTGLRISEAQSGYIDGDKFRIDDKCTATNIQSWLKRKLIGVGIESRFTPHDCRRTFATIANDNGVEPFIVERVLNHKMQGVMATYNYAEYEDERIKTAKVVEKAIREIVGQ
jgi:integrase